MRQPPQIEESQLSVAQTAFKRGLAVLTYKSQDGSKVFVAPQGRTLWPSELEVGKRAADWGGSLDVIERDAWAAQPDTCLPFIDFLQKR